MKTLKLLIFALLLFSTCISIKAQEKEISRNELGFDSLVAIINSDPELLDMLFSEGDLDEEEIMIFKEILNSSYNEILEKNDIRASDEKELLSSLSVMAEMVEMYRKLLQLDCDKTIDPITASFCSDYATLKAGFLIFYDPINKYAHIICIQNSYFIDSAIDLDFVVDKDYKIHLTETGMTDEIADDGETVIAEQYSLNKFLIEIENNGNFKIVELEDND